MAAKLTNVNALDKHMKANSYVEGVAPTQKDVSVFKAIAEPDAKSHPHAARWYGHIASFSASKAAGLPGTFESLGAPSNAGGNKGGERASGGGDGGEAAAKKEKAPKEKKEKAPKAPKEEKPKGPSPEDAAKIEAAKKEKLKQKVIKEGGKKGVEIEGASDMGGLDFFCTTMELPEGDVALLELSMVAMNAQPAEGDEERKGCSGHVGKMIFSAGVEQLAIVAYVPDGEFNKSADKVDCGKWLAHVCKAVDGKASGAPTAADSPRRGKVATAIVKSDPEKGKFALKDKDTAMAAAFAFLRENGAFPEDTGDDDDDECCFGDDAFDNIDEL